MGVLVVGLSNEEVAALADAFVDNVSATRILVAAGLAERELPSWNVSTAADFWWAVSALIANGKLPGGSRALFEAASAAYPANPLFAGRAAREPTIQTGRSRPSRNGLPGLPARYVPRDEDLARIRGQLLESAASTVVGLVGMGGSGKSTLARALVHDPAVRDAFPDGIVWIEVGQQPDLAARASQILAEFGDRTGLIALGEAPKRLRALLAGARGLVVLDDVWEPDVVETLRLPTGMRLLVTTRDRGVLFSDANAVHLATARDTLSRRLLAAYAGCAEDALPPAADVVLEQCGGLALALALAGAMVQGGRRWENVAERLRRADLGRLIGRFEHYPYPNLLAALQVSVDLLPAEQAARFLDLAVFEGRGAVPESVVAGLWQASAGISELDAEDLLDLLARHSLIQVDPAARTVRIHDLLIDYCRGSLAPGRLVELHGQLACWLFDQWGGLPAGLPLLRRAVLDHGTKKSIDAASGYGLANVCRHLILANEAEKLHQLLVLENGDARSGRSQLWYSVHERLDTTASYKFDLDLALRQAEREVDGTDSSSGRETAILREFRYMLMASAVMSVAGQLPEQLLVLLLQDGLWSATEVLAVARSIPHARSRVEALTALAPFLPDGILPQMLEDAREMGNLTLRAEFLAHLATATPSGFLKTLLEEIRRIPSWQERTWATAQVIRQLPADRTESMLDDVLRTALEREDPKEQIWAVYLAAPLLSPARRSREMAAMVPAARAITEIDIRISAYAAILEHLESDQRRDVLTEAVACAAQVADDFERIDAILELCPYLVECGDLKLPRAVLANVRTKSWGSSARLQRIASSAPAEMHEELILTAFSYEDPRLVSAVLTELAPRLTAQDLAWCLDHARSRPSEQQRADILVAIAGHLPVELLPAALLTAREIDEARHRSRALAELATRLAPAKRDEVVKEVTVSLPAIDDAEYRVNILTRLIETGADALITETFDLVEDIEDAGRRTRLLGRLAALSPANARGTVLSRALEASRKIGHIRIRIDALTELAPLLPSQQRRQAILEALSIARTPDADGPVDRVLLALAPRLPPDLARAALNAADNIEPLADRTKQIVDLAHHLPVDMLRETLDVAVRLPFAAEFVFATVAPRMTPADLEYALAVARGDPDDARYYLTELAPHVDEKERRRILDEVLANRSDKQGRSHRISRLAPIVTVDERMKLLKECADLQPPERAEALCGIIPTLPDELKVTVAAELVEVLKAVEPGSRQAAAVVAALPFLPEDHRHELLSMTLEEASRLPSRYSDPDGAISTLAPYLSGDLVARALAAARQIDVPSRSARTLAAISAILASPERECVLVEALNITDDVEREKYKVQALKEIAEKIDPDMLPELSTRVQTLEDPGDRARVLSAAAAACGAQSGAAWPGYWRPALREAMAAGRSSVLAVLPKAMLATRLADDPGFVRKSIELMTQNLWDSSGRAAAR